MERVEGRVFGGREGRGIVTTMTSRKFLTKQICWWEERGGKLHSSRRKTLRSFRSSRYLDVLHSCNAPLASRVPSLVVTPTARLPDLRAFRSLSIDPPHVHASIYLAIATLAAPIQSSIHRCFQHPHACSAPQELHTSMIPRLHDCSVPTQPRAYSTHSKAPEVFAFTSTRIHRASGTPYLHYSTSARVQRASRAPELHASSILASRSLHKQRASRVPELLRQTPPRPHTCSTPPDL